MAWKKLFNLNNNVVVNYEDEEPVKDSTPPNQKDLEVISSLQKQMMPPEEVPSRAWLSNMTPSQMPSTSWGTSSQNEMAMTMMPSTSWGTSLQNEMAVAMRPSTSWERPSTSWERPSTSTTSMSMPPPPPSLSQNYSKIPQENYFVPTLPQAPPVLRPQVDDTRTLPSANTFTAAVSQFQAPAMPLPPPPPSQFTSKVKKIIEHLRLIEGIDEDTLILLNIMDQQFYGCTIPDNGVWMNVTFRKTLTEYVKRSFIAYTKQGKSF